MGKTTHFGYQQVDVDAKQGLVRGVFDSVVDNYDLMNDVMSMGTHRLWKNYTIECSNVAEGDKVLDVAGGTGGLAIKYRKKVGHSGQVILSDINGSMLEAGLKNLLDQGIIDVEFVQTNAESLPFDDNTFDCVSIAFGLRNVTHKDIALEQMHRVLKKGGCLMVLEFSKVKYETLKKLYDYYSFRLIPKMGDLFAGDEQSYQYLAESIRKHPDQETLKTMALDAGFGFCEYHNLSGGIVAVHKAIKT